MYFMLCNGRTFLVIFSTWKGKKNIIRHKQERPVTKYDKIGLRKYFLNSFWLTFELCARVVLAASCVPRAGSGYRIIALRAMTGFSFNKAVFKPFMYKFSDHLSGKSAQQQPSSSDNIIDYRWWVGGRLEPCLSKAEKEFLSLLYSNRICMLWLAC